MRVPDVTGFTLGEALNVLKAAGITETVIRLTTPPRDKGMEYSGSSRVVRQLTSDDGRTEELIVCNPS
jgi:hypothetical protein